MSIQEASAISGYAVFTLQMFARNSEFAASKPRGNRGGWDICEQSFRGWLRRRKIKTANAAMQDQLKRRAE